MSGAIVYDSDGNTHEDFTIAQKLRLTLLKFNISSLTDFSQGFSSSALIKDLEKLVKLIVSLRSLVTDKQSDPETVTDSNQNPTRPTLEVDQPRPYQNLIPYVTEELGDIWNNALEELSKSPATSQNLKSKSINHTPLITLSDLLPLLLWRLGCTAEEIMRLLTGIEVQVTSPQGIRDRGILRLVASLSFTTPQSKYELDIATGDQTQFNLPVSAIIQSFDCGLCYQPRSAQSLLDQLKIIINQQFGAMHLWKSKSIEVLEPGQNWTNAQLSLGFGFQFLASYPSTPSGQNTVSSFDHQTTKDNSFDLEITPTVLLATQLKLTDTVILNRYVQEMIRQKLAVPLGQFLLSDSPRSMLHEPNFTLFPNIKGKIPLHPQVSQDLFNHFLIRKAWDFVEDQGSKALDNSQSSTLTNLIAPQISLGQLTQSLLWHTVRGSATITQLIGGIAARVLQPGQWWEQGTLRLVAILSADFSGYHWEIDIATREPPQLMGSLLDSTTVIDWEPHHIELSDTSIPAPIDYPWDNQSQNRHRFIEACTCQGQIIEQLRDTSPELGIWMDGVEIDWEEPVLMEPIWRSGLAQLILGLEWVPSSKNSF